MIWRDRVLDFRRVPASLLRAHPGNFRRHPERQRRRLSQALSEIGMADALLVRQTADGALELLDGHLRAELADDQLVPVLVLDLTEDEGKKLLATFDALSTLAEIDREALDALVGETKWLDEDLARWAAGDQGTYAGSPPDSADQPLPEVFQLVVTCQDEQDQRALYETLVDQGRKVRVLTL